MLLYKFIGIILMILGALIIRYFPDISVHQREEMTLTGIWIGIILFLIGIILLIFG